MRRIVRLLDGPGLLARPGCRCADTPRPVAGMRRRAAMRARSPPAARPVGGFGSAGTDPSPLSAFFRSTEQPNSEDI
jgi:hypothetical protein